MKKGDIVKAGNHLMDFTSVAVTVGKEYEVLDMSTRGVGGMDFVEIINDRGNRTLYDAARFRVTKMKESSTDKLIGNKDNTFYNAVKYCVVSVLFSIVLTLSMCSPEPAMANPELRSPYDCMTLKERYAIASKFGFAPLKMDKLDNGSTLVMWVHHNGNVIWTEDTTEQSCVVGVGETESKQF